VAHSKAQFPHSQSKKYKPRRFPNRWLTSHKTELGNKHKKCSHHHQYTAFLPTQWHVSVAAESANEKFSRECKWPVIYCNQLQARVLEDQRESGGSSYRGRSICIRALLAVSDAWLDSWRRVRKTWTNSRCGSPRLSMLTWVPPSPQNLHRQRETSKKVSNVAMLVVIDRGERCKFDIALLPK
jgi:hypothetical protein